MSDQEKKERTLADVVSETRVAVALNRVFHRTAIDNDDLLLLIAVAEAAIAVDATWASVPDESPDGGPNDLELLPGFWSAAEALRRTMNGRET